MTHSDELCITNAVIFHEQIGIVIFNFARILNRYLDNIANIAMNMVSPITVILKWDCWLFCPSFGKQQNFLFPFTHHISVIPCNFIIPSENRHVH